MYKAYQSAKMQVGNSTFDPITIELQNDKYEIKHDNLHNAVAAIQVATSLNTDILTGQKQSCGLMGSYLLCRAEQAYSTLYARALDCFIFSNECNGPGSSPYLGSLCWGQPRGS